MAPSSLASSRSAMAGTSVGRPSAGRRAGRIARAHQPPRAVMTPPNKDQGALDALERSEKERLERTDAFAELKDMAARKQSVNKPQVRILAARGPN